VGTIVRQVTRDQIVGPLSLLLQAQEGGFSIEHLHQVRHILEIEIAGLAAMQATEEGVAELEQIVAEMESVRDTPEDFAAKDADFHQGLAEMTHNPILIVLLDSIRDLMQEVRLLVTRYPRLHQQVMHDHYEILRRVAARDPEGARQAMQGHLEHARQIQHAVLNHDDDNMPAAVEAAHPA
jgi:GntR family transcriptional repressor for pyruvate dehydrogenase complex